ncbi:MAG: 16S rRNA (uracil(1498)-N(3))-methyltransferase [Zoogloeaceae bacterium]|jgi:16S rRNA (uracil1498-N3)-methyltransferase|nr:16S rRNA (uracil(1498)-N(3))-methyltransferase [Zoogloeaceae bacterium]
MNTPRFFCDLPLVSGMELDLPEAVARHAAQVLRLPSGAAVTLFDGRGGEYPARLEIIGKTKARARLGAWQDIERESPLRVTLAQAAQAADKMDFSVQKAVELGARVFQPLASRRSVTRLSGERQQKRESHWRTVALAACEQCGRNRPMEIRPIKPLGNWLTQEARTLPGLKLVFTPEAETGLSALAKTENAAREVTALIGAEGGLDATEIAAAREAGFIPLRLGSRILRTETAGVAILAALQNLWGDLGEDITPDSA